MGIVNNYFLLSVFLPAVMKKCIFCNYRSDFCIEEPAAKVLSYLYSKNDIWRDTVEQFAQIGEGLYFLKVPFGPVWTGVVLVDGPEPMMIDSAATAQDVDQYIVPALAQLGLAPGDVRWLLNTHCHGDHIGGHHRFRELSGCRIAAFDLAAPKVANPVPYAIRIRSTFPDYSPAPQSSLKGVPVDKVLFDGEVFGDLQLIHTPGHDDDCLCWYHIPTKTLITGDSLQANGTICQGIGFYQDLNGYEWSLNRLLALDAERILCGHDYDGIGWRIEGSDAVRRALSKCLDYIDIYHEYIKAHIELRDPARIAAALIRDLGCGEPERLFMALYTVTQHLKRISEE